MSLSRTDRIRSWLAWLMLKSLSCLPLRVSQWLGCLIGWFNYRLDTRAAKVTRTNLAICQPHLGESAREQLVRSSLLHTGMTMMETPAVWLGRWLYST